MMSSKIDKAELSQIGGLRIPKGKKMMTRNNTVFNWYINNFRVKLMWCACNPCYNQAEFKKKMKEKNKKEDKTGNSGRKKFQPSNNFKIELLTMLSDEDFKMFECQF
eukprot:13113823-Ditylum_brightwellii.AAC.1